MYLLATVPSTSSGAASCQGSSSRRPLQEVARRISDVPVFTVESPYMPSGVKEAVIAKKRPSARDRKAFVERIVDKCREDIPNLERAIFGDIALQLVQDFPDSFKDTCPISIGTVQIA